MRQERRSGPRHPIQFDVVVDDDARFHAGATVDLSEAGALIEAERPIAPGAVVRLIPLVDTRAPLLELRGRVVRSADRPRGGHAIAVELDLGVAERAAYEALFDERAWSVTRAIA